MLRVFISYRRQDLDRHAIAYCQLIKHSLESSGHQVFLDVSSIKGGDDWIQSILAEVKRCHVLLVVIGPKWYDELTRRKGGDDWVVMEIQTALEREKAILPVLIGDETRQPTEEELPEPIKGFHAKNTQRLRASDIEPGLRKIEAFVKGAQSRFRTVALGQKSSLLQTIGIRLVHVLPGKFVLGDDESPRGRDKPANHAQVTYDFFMCDSPITLRAFREFTRQKEIETLTEQKIRAGGAPKTRRTWKHPGFAQTLDHPVVCVSYKDAELFANWLTEKSGWFFRLPTEAEWEYACKAGLREQHYHHNLKEIAWSHGGGDRSASGTAEVRSKLPNSWGLYDMLGNVWEWCQDYFHPYTRASFLRNPERLDENPKLLRVIRGGSWVDTPEKVRASVRGRAKESKALNNLGFRLITTLAPPDNNIST